MKTTQIKKVGCSLALLTIVASAVAISLPADDITIYRMDDGNIRRLYSVPRSKLEGETNRWNSARAPFPADIQSYADKGRQHIKNAKKLEKPIRLYGFHVSKYRDDLWYFVFSYGFVTPERGSPREPLEYLVVMLLDGTIASEHSTVIPIPRQ